MKKGIVVVVVNENLDEVGIGDENLSLYPDNRAMILLNCMERLVE